MKALTAWWAGGDVLPVPRATTALVKDAAEGKMLGKNLPPGLYQEPWKKYPWEALAVPA